MNTTALGRKLRPSVVLAIILSLLMPMIAPAAGPVAQLLWSTQPGSASTGSPFNGQPKLVTADAAGNPTTAGLAGSVLVTIDTVPPGGLTGGARTVDLGTNAANGSLQFTDLQIDTAGGYALTALTGNGTNEVFTPTNGIGNCQLWLDASDGGTLTVTANNNLQSWADKSGTGNNATNVTANSIANTPLTNSNPDLAAFAFGGARVVSFYGTNRLNINLDSITNRTFTVEAVTELSPAETANNDYFMGSPFYANGTDHTMHVGYRNLTQYTFAQYADDLNVPWPGYSTPLVVSHVHGVGNHTVYINGTQAGTGGANYLSTLTQPNVGRGNGGNFHGDIAEIIVYSTNLTTLQRVQVENYLFNKWLGQLSSSVTSAAFFVSGGSGGVPKGFRFSQQPTDATAGVVLTPSVTVTVTNAVGGAVPGLTVFMTPLPGSGALNGTLSQVTDANGVATFPDLSLNVAGKYQLTATIPGSATNTSSNFNITAGAASQLAFQIEPSGSASAGVAFGTQPVVSLEDAFGNVISNSTEVITASQTAGGNLSQTADNSVQVTAVAGTATFSGLLITNSGTSTVTFTDGTYLTNSIDIGVVAGPANTITVQQQPDPNAEVGVAFSSQPVVLVADAFGNPVTNNTVVAVRAGSSVLTGDLSEVTTAGVATFTSLAVTTLGNATLTFTAGTATVNSTLIAVGPGPATTIVWTTQPGSALAGSPFGQQPVLKTADAGGNITTIGLSETNWVVVHQISGNGLVGNSFTYNIGTDGSNGVITFQNLEIDTPGAGNVLAADYLGSSTDPTNNIPNCILWLDAYDSSTLNFISTNVVQWTDKSGTGNNAVNTANYPSTNLDTALPLLGYGGQHTVSFHGNNWLNVDYTSLEGQPYTVIAVDVAGANSANGNSYFFGSEYNGLESTLHMGYRNANTFTFAQYADDLNWTAPANFSFSTPRLWTGRLNSSATRQIFLNGILEATGNAAALPGTLVNGEVGRGNGGSYNGDLAEIIVYNRDLGDDERTTVEQYLTHKWLANSRGLTVPFTVTSLVPQNFAIASGPVGNVTLSFTGAAGTRYRILETTNLVQPVSLWRAVATNTLDGSGAWRLTVTNNVPDMFYRVVTP